ncbi:MAG: MoaD/ThiS family protein [Candidatus Atribacteria bacterium]|nr:MoaD/ThiS family protein [Candidatus Atribacteria bacterium]
MKVKLFIYSNLKNYIKNYDEKNGILKEVSIPQSIRQFLNETIHHERVIDAISIVVVNKKVVPFREWNRHLKDKDVIKIYPPIGGG